MSFDAGAGLSVSEPQTPAGRLTADYPHQEEKSQPDRSRAGPRMLRENVGDSGYSAVQVAAIIFTSRTFSDGLRAGRRPPGQAACLVLVGLFADRAADFDRMPDVVARASRSDWLTSFSELALMGGAAGVTAPDVPTALSFPTSDPTEGSCPFLPQPSDTPLPSRSLRHPWPPASAEGVRGGAGWVCGGVDWAERPTANTVATKVPAIARFIGYPPWTVVLGLRISCVACASVRSRVDVVPHPSSPQKCRSRATHATEACRVAANDGRMQVLFLMSSDVCALSGRVVFTYEREVLRPPDGVRDPTRTSRFRMGYNRGPARKWRNWQTRRT